MPGHHDAGNEYTSLDDAMKATEDAMQLGLAGTKKNNSANTILIFQNLLSVTRAVHLIHFYNLRNNDMGYQ